LRGFAGEFEGAVEGAEAAGDFGEGGGADGAEVDGGGGDGVDLVLGGGLGPREGVEDRISRVAEGPSLGLSSWLLKS
jgi:hypothetical protein